MTEHWRGSMTEQGDDDRTLVEIDDRAGSDDGTGQGVAITASVRNKVFTAQELEMGFSNHSP